MQTAPDNRRILETTDREMDTHMTLDFHNLGGEPRGDRSIMPSNDVPHSVVKPNHAVVAFLFALVVASILALPTVGSAADRTTCFLPIGIDSPISDSAPAASPPISGDAAILKSGVSPTEAFRLGPTSRGGDLDWWRYLEVWRAHHEDPEATAIRRWLTIPQNDEVQVTIRRGRVSPKFLPWRAASFVVVQTPHFEILSRADAKTSNRVARDLERFYWTWTQMFFPLWTGRDQAAIGLANWNPTTESVDDYLSKNATSRLTLRRRHRVVLLPDERSYQMTISHPQIAAGRPSTIAASAGFYSDTLSASFFFPQDDTSGMAHETCHQLFEEASDHARSRTTSLNTKDFWLVEGIAGHFESIQTSNRLACVGGWDSPRLQYARYQTLIAQQPIASIAELQGDRREVQRRSDLARWYSHSILQTHFAIDHPSRRPQRSQVYQTLAKIYGVDVSDFACLKQPSDTSRADNDRIDRFLMIDDDHLNDHPIPGSTTAICLAGCEVSLDGWKTIPPLPLVHWFDASRTPIDDAQVSRILVKSSELDQLSLEATKITSNARDTLGRARKLRELDLSWTAIDDSVIESLTADKTIETIWLTGTGVTDASISKLSNCPNLQTIDVQRTRITDTGLKQLQTAIPGLDLNPLQLTP